MLSIQEYRLCKLQGFVSWTSLQIDMQNIVSSKSDLLGDNKTKQKQKQKTKTKKKTNKQKNKKETKSFLLKLEIQGFVISAMIWYPCFLYPAGILNCFWHHKSICYIYYHHYYLSSPVAVVVVIVVVVVVVASNGKEKGDRLSEDEK